MTEQELIIWSAGFFDGEGCACISRQKRKDTSWVSYVLSASVHQKDIRPLEVLLELYGGRIIPYVNNGVQYYRWVLNSSAAMRALQTMKPYMVLKGERAEICIQFQVSLMEWNKEYGRRGYPDFVTEAREQFYLRMKDLNKRGVSISNPTPKAPGNKRGCKNFFNAAKIADTKSKESQLIQ